jgi:hypothetical protein
MSKRQEAFDDNGRVCAGIPFDKPGVALPPAAALVKIHDPTTAKDGLQ